MFNRSLTILLFASLVGCTLPRRPPDELAPLPSAGGPLRTDESGKQQQEAAAVVPARTSAGLAAGGDDETFRNGGAKSGVSLASLQTPEPTDTLPKPNDGPRTAPEPIGPPAV